VWVSDFFMVTRGFIQGLARRPPGKLGLRRITGQSGFSSKAR
jgi:hypothetical protein